MAPAICPMIIDGPHGNVSFRVVRSVFYEGFCPYV